MINADVKQENIVARVRLENLSYDVLIEGAVKSIYNAQSLCDEAEILHGNGKYPRAYALSHFAREEFGKCMMLYRAAIEVATGIDIDWKKLSKRFRDHKQKITNDRAISMMLFGGMDFDGGPLEWKDFFAGIDFTNDRKNSCLYVDLVDGQFTAPIEVISEDLSRRNLDLAVFRIAKLTPMLTKLNEVHQTPKESLQKIYPRDFVENPEAFIEHFMKARRKGTTA